MTDHLHFDTVLEAELLDEATLAGEPICEDDHLATDGEILPPCSVVAVAQLTWTECHEPPTLICQNIYDWAMTPPFAYCTNCGPGCLTIRTL